MTHDGHTPDDGACSGRAINSGSYLMLIHAQRDHVIYAHVWTGVRMRGLVL